MSGFDSINMERNIDPNTFYNANNYFGDWHSIFHSERCRDSNRHCLTDSAPVSVDVNVNDTIW